MVEEMADKGAAKRTSATCHENARVGQLAHALPLRGRMPHRMGLA